MRNNKQRSSNDEVETRKNGKTYGKKGSNKRKRNSSKPETLDSTGRDNDPNWYFFSKELAEQATQLSFQNMLGLGDINGYQVPTICKINCNPSPGISKLMTTAPRYNGWGTAIINTSDDPIAASELNGLNLMQQKMYTLLSTFSGRTSNYAPQDVGTMILAISSIAELSEFMRRAFGVALTYNPRNRMLPKALIDSMGIDPDDLFANLSNYRMAFNVQMSRINQIPLLDNIGYIRKSRDMYQKIYVDDQSNMAQIFYFSPHSVWEIDETSYSGGTVLVTKYVDQSASLNMSSYLTMLEGMITSLLMSTTLNLIYADLLNLANKLKVPTWQFDYLAENYIVMPEYNQTALLQFHNSNALGDPWGFLTTATGITNPTTNGNRFTRANNVYPDPNNNTLVYCPLFQGLYRTRPATVVDMFSDNPSVEDRIEALRFSAMGSGYYKLGNDIVTGNTGVYGMYPAISDHYVVYYKVYSNSGNTPTVTVGRPSYNDANHTLATFTGIETALDKFDWAPVIEWHDTNWDTGYMTSDLTYFTEIPYQYLQKVNNMIFVGLFDYRV